MTFDHDSIGRDNLATDDSDGIIVMQESVHISLIDCEIRNLPDIDLLLILAYYQSSSLRLESTQIINSLQPKLSRPSLQCPPSEDQGDQQSDSFEERFPDIPASYLKPERNGREDIGS